MLHTTDYTNSTILERPIKRRRIDWETKTLPSVDESPDYL